MKNGAALSLVLAPGGTAMFWVTQAGWAKAGDTSHTAEIIVPARTANLLFISSPGVDASDARAFAEKYADPSVGGQGGWAEVKKSAVIAAKAGTTQHLYSLLRQQREGAV